MNPRHAQLDADFRAFLSTADAQMVAIFLRALADELARREWPGPDALVRIAADVAALAEP